MLILAHDILLDHWEGLLCPQEWAVVRGEGWVDPKPTNNPIKVVLLPGREELLGVWALYFLFLCPFCPSFSFSFSIETSPGVWGCLGGDARAAGSPAGR